MPNHDNLRDVRLSELIQVIEARFDPSWAESWDAVGLVCGDPDAEVTSALLAVDPTAAVVDEALAEGAQLLVTHHPLLLRPVSAVAAIEGSGSNVAARTAAVSRLASAASSARRRS